MMHPQTVERARRVAHTLRILPIPQHKGWRYAGDCTCGWISPSCSTVQRVYELHAEQKGELAYDRRG